MVLTEEKIAEFAQFLLEEEKTEITIKKYVRDVQKFFEFTEEKELHRDEYNHLADVAQSNGNQRLMLIIETISSTGIRISELKFITVEVINEKRAGINCKGKHRVVLLTKKLCKVLKEYTKKKIIR